MTPWLHTADSSRTMLVWTRREIGTHSVKLSSPSFSVRRLQTITKVFGDRYDRFSIFMATFIVRIYTTKSDNTVQFKFLIALWELQKFGRNAYETWTVISNFKNQIFQNKFLFNNYLLRYFSKSLRNKPNYRKYLSEDDTLY